jgi:hypothetical protein
MALKFDESWNLVETGPDHLGKYTASEFEQQVDQLRCPACDGRVDVSRITMPDGNETTYHPGRCKCRRGCQPKRP